MIKLILSNAYDLKELGAKYKSSNLYLGYVKNKGYVLIQENNDDAYFNCIPSRNEPDRLSVNWQYESEEIMSLNGILSNILVYVQPIELEDTITDLIDWLLADLSKEFGKYNYASPNTIRNTKIKEFALNPVKQFDFYENYGAEPLSKDDYKTQKRDVFTGIEDNLNSAVMLFLENQAKYGKNKKGKIVPIITEKQFIKKFNNIISDAFGNPLVNLRYGGAEKVNRIEAIDYVTDEFNIKGVYNNGKESVYYFNNEYNYFQPLKEETLKNLIIGHLGIKLLKQDYNAIYKSLETNDTVSNNILVFKNMLFDMDYMEELNYPICNYNRKDYLATSLIGYEDENQTVQLIDYDNDLDFMKIYEVDPDENEMTFVEKTLREITIPKDNKEDLSIFHDCLQRIGCCILGANPYKVITLYYNPEGNNGKGILKLLMELIFNKGAYSLTPQTFEQTFSLPTFENRKCLLIDEINKNDFNHLKPTLKRISSPEARLEERNMYSPDTMILSNFPMLFIFANELINIGMEETALFDRNDIIRLPNRFVTEKEYDENKNHYILDRQTESKIKEDVEGLSWLITASIKMFVNMRNANTEFILRQTPEQTMDIVLDTDYVTKFIRLYTVKDEDLIPNEFTTVEEIYQQYQKYMELNNKIISENELTVKRQIGTAIKRVYNIKGKVSDSPMYYKQGNNISSYQIKLKSFEDIEKESKLVYIINEDAENLSSLEFSKENKLVYGKIQNGVNTINLLNKDLPKFDNYRIVKELLNLDLIRKTDETNLTDTVQN